MGQAHSSAALPTGPSAIETSELSDITYERSLGGVRFLKTIRAKHRNGVVVAKLITKVPGVQYKRYGQLLREESQKLKGVCNVLPYSRIRETETFGLLVRQYIHHSLYDRISIRPFLELIEKKWIAFQLLCAVKDCHTRNVFHGDIKSENVLVTSWGWVYLTDFASQFKPVYLPEDNPADFTYYYDASARRTCYLAPERFLAAGESPREGNTVQWNMDIFSLGCVLAELFTESPAFTLSQLYRYRKGEYDPTITLLNKVDDEHIKSLITSMIRLDPTERWHASDYLDEHKGKAFPLYFYNHFHTLMQEITDPSSGSKFVITSDANNGGADDRIDRIYEDYEMLAVSLDYHGVPIAPPSQPSYLTGLFPMQIDLPNSCHTAHAAPPSGDDNGTFILLNVVTASIRSCARSASKVRACELLLAFAERLPDEAKLDRILPYVVLLLEDTSEMVLVAALRTMTQLLSLVTVVSPVNSFLFTQYIFPRLQTFVKTPGFTGHSLVRATYAACLGSLADAANRFLDVMQALKSEGAQSSSDKGVDGDVDDLIGTSDAYDSIRLETLGQFEGQTKVFLTDTDTAVRRAFLTSVSSLCVFFGETMASDVILSHLNTYLNDPDWLLKCAFFKTIVGVAAYIGGANLEEYLLPLMLQALTDPQEFVVEQALRSMASMADMGLLQRPKTWELIDTVARFEMHPNIWIKEAAAHFVSAATTYLSMADVRILVAPLVRPYLKVPISTLTESELLDALRKPLPRTVLDLAIQWAGKVEQSAFWKPARESRQLSSTTASQMPPQSSVAALGPKSLAKVPKTDEDEQWLGRLRNAGMRSEDEVKLLAFREFLWRAARRATRDSDRQEEYGLYEQIVSLTKLKINPQTVIFSDDVKAYEEHIEHQNRTIAEAIEEASGASKGLSPHDVHASDAQGIAGRSDAGVKIVERTLSGLRTKTSGSLSSSPSSGIGLLGRDIERGLRSKAAAAGLLGSTDLRNKATAEVGTADTTAAGRLNLPVPSSRRASPSGEQGIAVKPANTRASHNYTGHDPTVLKLLDAVYVDNFPIDAADFGPNVPLKAGVIPSGSSQQGPSPWRPQGRLVAVLGEHTAAITRILVAPSHIFFLTASIDGSIKVWDSARLERNVTYRSRQTYRLPAGVRVASLCFIEGTHSFVCSGSDGSVHAVRVNVSESNNTTQYGKLRVIKDWQIPSANVGEHAVWSEHFRGEKASTLVLATNLGRIIAVDLKYMSIIFDLHNPAHHGTPTSFCIGRRHDWLLVGTSHGVLDLWDMRFHVRVRSWTFANPAPITRLQLHSSRKSSRRNMFCMTGGTAPGELTVWSVEKAICYEVYRPAHGNGKNRLHLRDYELRNMDDEAAEAPLSRMTGTDPIKAEQNSNLPSLSTVSFFGGQRSPKDPDMVLPFAITGGPDGKVRFWDCDRLEGCRLISGGAPDEQPTYTFSQLSMDTRVLSERAAESSVQTEHVESNKVAPGKKTANAGSSKPTSRYETIRMSAQNLLNAHLDTITDVALLEQPFGMVLSADRAGQIFVHQ